MKCLFYLISVAVILIFNSCDDKYVVVSTTLNLPKNSKPIDDSLLTDSNNATIYSRLSVPGSYGITSKYIIPKELKGKELEVVFEGKARTNYMHSNAYVNVTAYAPNGQNIIWNGVSLKYYFTEVNKWCYFKDSVHIKPESWEPEYHNINAFAFLGTSNNEKFDIDSFKVTIKAKE